jgi:inorganic triphosphatase YgiF
MKNAPASQPKETELKLALLARDAAALHQQLAALPVLARSESVELQLHNIYYDNAGQTLRKQALALRLRQVEGGAKTQWLQTLKMGGSGNSALSQRGEWETAVPAAKLSWPALKATPWTDIDPDGELFRQLAPVFVTRFDRTSWTVHKPGGSTVEVSLDVGQVLVEGKAVPICELELELLAGPPSALFNLARQIARTVATLPEHRSKAERGYALAEASVGRPLRARPPALKAGMAPLVAVQCVLREMLCQFTANLNALRQSDDPALLHQARVGWRRFRSAYRLFRPLPGVDTAPSWESLKTLLTLVGELRDLDVARFETLPKFAQAYAAGNAGRQDQWQALTLALTQAAELQRKAVVYALETPTVGATFLALTQWLEELPQHPRPEQGTKQAQQRGTRQATRQASEPAAAHKALKTSFRSWSRQRIKRLHQKLKAAHKDADTAESQHQARILAKRLRYGIEALRPLLHKRRSNRWYQQASGLQQSIGTARDLVQANLLVAKLGADLELTAFLRGVVAGQLT